VRKFATVALLLIVVVSLVFAGCGSSSTGTSQGGGEQATQSEQVPAESQPASDSQPTGGIDAVLDQIAPAGVGESVKGLLSKAGGYLIVTDVPDGKFEMLDGFTSALCVDVPLPEEAVKEALPQAEVHLLDDGDTRACVEVDYDADEVVEDVLPDEGIWGRLKAIDDALYSVSAYSYDYEALMMDADGKSVAYILTFDDDQPEGITLSFEESRQVLADAVSQMGISLSPDDIQVSDEGVSVDYADGDCAWRIDMPDTDGDGRVDGVGIYVARR